MINKIKNFIHLQYRRLILGSQNRDILIYGFRDNSPFWKEKEAKDRINYALENPWVFNYDFGHRELIQEALSRVI